MDAAVALLGSLLVRTDVGSVRVGRIVEVEAYGGEEDAASHARSGRTARNRAMYGRPGHAYVYRVYGMHRCLNVVTGPPGLPSAVLVRAIEPIGSPGAMRAARVAAAAAGRRTADPRRDGADGARIGRLPDARLAAGPALVAAAFSVTTGDDGVDLCDPGSGLRLEVNRTVEDAVAADEANGMPSAVMRGPRIGIAYAAPPWDAIEWRLWLAGSPAVSRPAGTRRSGG